MSHAPDCACREHPLPSSMFVRDALAAYLDENGFTTEGYDSPTAKGSIFGREISIPNPPSHRRAIRVHDLHHVATGYGTDHAGEGELSAWQARRGLHRGGAYVAAIVATNTVVGLVMSPRRTIAAFMAAGRGESLFDAHVDYASWLDRNVGELRAFLGIPEKGLARQPRGRHARAPGA